MSLFSRWSLLALYFFSILVHGGAVPLGGRQANESDAKVESYTVSGGKTAYLFENDRTFKLISGANKKVPSKQAAVTLYELSEGESRTLIELFKPEQAGKVYINYSDLSDVYFESAVTFVAASALRVMRVAFSNSEKNYEIDITGESDAFPDIIFSNKADYIKSTQMYGSTYRLNIFPIPITPPVEPKNALDILRDNAPFFVTGLVGLNIYAEVLFIVSILKSDLKGLSCLLRFLSWVFGFPIILVQEIMGQLIFYYWHGEFGGIYLLRNVNSEHKAISPESPLGPYGSTNQ